MRDLLEDLPAALRDAICLVLFGAGLGALGFVLGFATVLWRHVL